MRVPVRRAADPWLPMRRPGATPRLRVFCFPNAGGGASAFRAWTRDAFGPEVEVCPVQLPGRENRIRESAFRQMAPLVDALEPALRPHLDRPYVLLGHSMGASVAWELAHRLAQDGDGKGPELLVALGRRAPHLPPTEEPIYDLPDAELIARLREYDGTPPAVLEHEELMALMLPLLRADFELIETHRGTERPPLACPIVAWGGRDDDDAPRADLDAWRELTTGPCRVRMFDGGHFFLHQDPEPVLAALREELAPLLARA